MTYVLGGGAPGPSSPRALTALDGPAIVTWAGLCAQGLKDRQAEINRLNVFPIPDSDTGSNMAHTMTVAHEAALGVDATNLAHVTAALASGAVRGARGNSGLMISQVMRALATTSARSVVDATAVAAMLHLAECLVRTAISDPVEGTLLTVLRAASDAAGAIADAEGSLIATASAARDAAEQALQHTPSQLPALAAAGVVDAGGTGLVVILDALCSVIANDAPAAGMLGSTEGAHSGSVEHGESNESESATATGEIEVMFFFTAPAEHPEKAVEELTTLAERVGNSVVIGAADERSMTVHVHTRRAGELIEAAYALGEVTDLRLEVLLARQQPKVELPALQPIVALVPPGPAEEWFRSVGAVPLASDEPQAIERALQHAGGGPVAVLTNGQPSGRLIQDYSDIELTVIDTGSLVGGMVAMAVYDTGSEFEDNIDEMIDAASSQRRAHTTADQLLDTLNDTIGDGELVTIVYSQATDEPQITAAVEGFEELYPDLEFYTYHLEGLTLNGEPVDVEIGVE